MMSSLRLVLLHLQNRTVIFIIEGDVFFPPAHLRDGKDNKMAWLGRANLLVTTVSADFFIFLMELYGYYDVFVIGN